MSSIPWPDAHNYGGMKVFDNSILGVGSKTGGVKLINTISKQVLFEYEPEESNLGFVFDMHLHQAKQGKVDLLAILTCDEGYA